jgi:AhpD family alkylhydroperoxidase
MARVPYRRREDAGDDTAIFDRLETERRVPTPHVFLAMTHAPDQLDGLLTYAGALRRATELGPRRRELVILAIAHLKGGAYIALHHEKDALAAGVTPEQVAAVPDETRHQELFDDEERAILAIGRALATDGEVPDEAWASASLSMTHQQLVQLVLTGAWYANGVLVTKVLGIDIEDEYADTNNEEPVQ